MTRQLLALPVNQGDAFFLRSKKRRFLVDGGGSKAQLLQLLTSVIGTTGSIDAVICTHADSDHANGLLGLFLPGSGIKVREVWLPGRWLMRPDLLLRPGYFLDEVFEETKKAQFESEDELGEQGDGLASSGEFNERNPDTREESESYELDELLAEALNRKAFLDTYHPSAVWWFPDVFNYSTPSHAQRFAVAVELAQRIRELLTKAYHHGARIRLFDYSAFMRVGKASGGEQGVLEPVNSREERLKLRKKVSALDFLRLTVSNRESLVFWAPEESDTPGALFCADSDLGFGMQLATPRLAPVVTAPHHGAESNAHAYRALNNWTSGLSGVTWVRSDRLKTTRPGPTFRHLPQPRFCTRCQAPNASAQTVQLRTQAGCWGPMGSVIGCSC